MMGVYGMVLGFLKLGFLLEFISLPVLSGFISAVAITIILNQIESLLGEDGIGNGTATQIHDIFHQLPTSNGYACAVGFTGILLLVILEQSGKRWGEKNRAIWLLSITRAFICLVIYTGVSYGVNKSRNTDDYLFEIVQVNSSGIEHPRIPGRNLISKIASRSIAVFIGAAIEHTAIARAFGARNDYATDQSQELCYFGVTNFFNSFFHAMGVGGAMSRTAVNSSCKVKSPLSGLVTTAVVLVCIFELMGTLYWIPKATLAAIIITAVWPLISPPSTFYRYWKTSLADFVSSMIAFWVSLFVSTEIGIAASVAFNIVYCLLRQVFTPSTIVGSSSFAESEPEGISKRSSSDTSESLAIPPDTRIFKFNESFFFPNAHNLKGRIMDSVQTFHAPVYNSIHGPETERNWSVVGEKRVARLRKKENVRSGSELPPIKLVVLDFTKVNHSDVTAVSYLREFFHELRKYAGSEVEVRFVGMSSYIKQRFERGGLVIVMDEYASETTTNQPIVLLYKNMADAVTAPRVSNNNTENLVAVEKNKITRKEDV